MIILLLRLLRLFPFLFSGHRQLAIENLALRHQRITLQLNAEGVKSPRARQGRHRSWSPSIVRTILFNPIYKGDVVWGRTKKRDAWDVDGKGIARRRSW